MIGQLFVHFAPGPNNVTSVRTGVVKAKVGPDHWQLTFDGSNYKFSNVFKSEQLEQFAFFDTRAALTAFLDDLKSQQQQAQQQAPVEGEVITQ